MKVTLIQMRFRLIMLMAAFTIVAGCAKIDEMTNIDNLNKNDDKIQLRKYSGVPLDIPPLVQFILDKKDTESLLLNNNMRKVCDYTKLPIHTVTLEEWNSNPKILDNVRVLSVLDTRKLNNKSIDILTDFVARGGTLYLPFGSEDRRFSYLVGINAENDYETDAKAAGFYFNSEMIPGIKNTVYSKNVKFFGIHSKAFSNKIKVLATAANDPNYPLIIENTVGKGRVIYFNSTYFLLKDDRGLLLSGLLRGLEGIPYPIVSTGVIFLDDFPAPLYDIKKEPVASELNLTITDYVHNVWWPDLLKFAEQYRISYTAMTTFDYNVNTKPPFLFREWDSKKVKIGDKETGLSNWLVNDVMKHGHELAFHGYNHVSLTVPDWKNPDFMVMSLKAAEKKWEVNDFGALPTSYVPPSNIIDRVGVRQLKKGMPSIKFMCSILVGEKNTGGGREFDFDPYEPELFDFPRVSSGFYVDNDLRFLIYSLYMYTGIWSHFVHPDDIYQIIDKNSKGKFQYDLRNYDNLGWYKTPGTNRAMVPEFHNLLSTLKKNFPQIRFLNATESGIITNDWRASYFNHKASDGLYTVEKLKPEESQINEQYWFMYVTSENQDKVDRQLKKVGATFKKSPCMDGSLYSIRTGRGTLTVPDLNYKTPEQINSLTAVSQRVKADFRSYLAEAARIAKEHLWYADYDKNLALELANLKKQMMSEPQINPKVWEKYAEYLSWQEDPETIWKLLEEHCIKYPLAENIMFSKRLAEIVYYPNDLIHEKWMSAQMLVTPNDKDLLNSYVAYFYSPENQEKIKIALVNLLKVDTSHDSFMKYLEYLLSYEPQNAIPELDKLKPSAEYGEYTTAIMWIYADNNNFQKAYEWSLYSTEIDFYTQMLWLIELKDYPRLIREYEAYVAKNPDDYRVKALMSSSYHDLGKFKESWILANQLPDEATDKEPLRKMLNTDVIYEERDVQLYLVEHETALFYPDVLEKIQKNERLENASFINYDTSLQSNKNFLASYTNVLSYNLLDKKRNIHGIGVTYSSMYRIETNVQDYIDNRSHDVFGFQYQYNNPKSFDKLQYWSRARYEYSTYNKKSFVHFGAGANFSKNKSYSSAELTIAPHENGPSYSKSIYRYQLNLYQNNYFFKHWNTTLSLEGNYYIPSEFLNKTYYTKESFEGVVIGKIIYDRWMENKHRLQPFVEASRSQASMGAATIPLSSGYPYWMIDDRFFYGGGLGYSIGRDGENFNMKIEAAWFKDDYTDHFSRFMGNLDYQIFDYTSITCLFEYYLQEKFYSNALQFGIKHNLKKRQKK